MLSLVKRRSLLNKIKIPIMIKRIQKIQNVGKFVDCQPPGCQFTESNIIFGNNTCGKSTLTAIFRSLQSGNNNLLIGRKTFGSNSQKKVEIDFETASGDQTIVFQNQRWDSTYEDILIFDTKFIAENIFDGETITYNHQLNLNQVIIGQQGKVIKDKIDSSHSAVQEKVQEKRIKTIFYSRTFRSYDLEKFIKLKEIEGIEAKIDQKKREILLAQKRTQIEKAITNARSFIAKLGFTELREVLKKDIGKQNDLVEKHIKENWLNPDASKKFLSEGLALLKGEQPNCVFCGQGISKPQALALLGAYKETFKEEYQQAIIELQSKGNGFKSWNVVAFATKLDSDLKKLGLEIKVNGDTIPDIQNNLSDKKAEIDKEIEQKQANFDHAVDFSGLDFIKSFISDLDKTLGGILPGGEGSKPIENLEKELEELTINQKRFEPCWIEFCKDYQAIEKEANAATKERENARAELAKYSESVFAIHAKKINGCLKKMDADFEIDEFTPIKNLIGQNERIFALKFHGTHVVKINETSDQKPNFSNTLSESDKRLLAFTFFMSLASTDLDLKKKIVIFDDPISSFDIERKRATAHLIADLRNEANDKPRQKIMLTHEEMFLRELLFLEEFKDSTLLRVESKKDADGKRVSGIRHCDFEEEFPDDGTINRLRKLKDILEKEDFSQDFANDCRKVMENIFKKKYYFKLKDANVLLKSVRTYTDTLFADPADAAKRTKLIRICDELNIESHDSTRALSNGDKKSILIEFFDCVEAI